MNRGERVQYYLGIDGGGTKTVAAVSDEKGNVLLKTVGKTINFYSVGMEKARENLLSVTKKINSKLGEIKFKSVFIGCSALDGIATAEISNGLCKDIINSDNIKVGSDLLAALGSADVDICPCVAICGTGSMAIGKDKKGNVITKGGWGHIIGDEGSAYSIAINALKCCGIFFDSKEKTRLVEEAEKYFGVESFRQAIDIIYSEKATKDFLAGFAPCVSKSALQGDVFAETIIVNEAHCFARTVLTLLAEVKECSVLSVYGGVFQHNELFTQTFSENIKEIYPELKIEALKIPPEEGALKIAREIE